MTECENCAQWWADIRKREDELFRLKKHPKVYAKAIPQLEASIAQKKALVKKCREQIIQRSSIDMNTDEKAYVLLDKINTALKRNTRNEEDTESITAFLQYYRTHKAEAGFRIVAAHILETVMKRKELLIQIRQNNGDLLTLVGLYFGEKEVK